MLFRSQIAEPLEKLKTKVKYTSDTVDFITPLMEKTFRIVNRHVAGTKAYAMIMNMQGSDSYVKELYYLNKLENPTNNFDGTNYIFRDLETAKNIAEDLELSLKDEDKKVSLNRFDDIKYTKEIKEPGEIVANNYWEYLSFEKYKEKAEELMKKFPE